MPTIQVHYDGWLASPEAVRRKLGVGTGDRLEVEVADGAVVLRPSRRADAAGRATPEPAAHLAAQPVGAGPEPAAARRPPPPAGQGGGPRGRRSRRQPPRSRRRGRGALADSGRYPPTSPRPRSPAAAARLLSPRCSRSTRAPDEGRIRIVPSGSRAFPAIPSLPRLA